jgi:hypothetical protein
MIRRARLVADLLVEVKTLEVGEEETQTIWVHG